jgi:hypothetical protein
LEAARLCDLQTAKLNLQALDDLRTKLLLKKKTMPANAVEQDRRMVQALTTQRERTMKP